MTPILSRRRFLAALAGSAVAAGAPLPLGFPKQEIAWKTYLHAAVINPDAVFVVHPYNPEYLMEALFDLEKVARHTIDLVTGVVGNFDGVRFVSE